MTSFINDSQFTIDNNVVKGREVSYHDDRISFGEFIFHSLNDHPDLVGQVDSSNGEEYTYRQMRERSVRCALWMQSQGLCPRDVVALCSDNHLDFAMPCFAALYLGAVFSPWATTMNTEDYQHQMNIAKPKIVFANENSAAVVAEAAKKEKLEVKIIVFGCVRGFLEYDSVIAEPSIGEVAKFDCSSIESPDEIASIMFSSGTTGSPKGVALSHRALNMQFHLSKALGMEGKVCLSFSASCWITGIYDIMWSVLSKIPKILTPLFEENSTCTLIEKYKANWVFLSPTMINRLLNSDAVSRYDLSSVSRVIYTGTWLSVATHKAFAELLPNAEIFGGYGLTELGGWLSLQSTKSKPGSCGQIMENAQLKVIDPETGRTQGANEKGEILLKSVSMMSCYYNNPQATYETIDNDGWLHTGDLGYYDEAGEIFVVDRIKDIIRLADYDISPFEIENVILSHPGVRDVAVVGKPHPDGDEYPMAFVVRAWDSSDINKQVTEEEIVNLVASELSDSRKQLRAGVRFIDRIPRTPASKIRRTALRDLVRTM